MRRVLYGILVCLILLSGCAKNSTPAPEELVPVSLAMGYIPNVQFTPVYVALERGYFKDEGIELTLDYGMETDLLQRLAADEVDFAITSGDQVILARSNDLPVRCVYNWYQHFPVCVVSLSSSDITEPADLEGKTIGTPSNYGASYIGWLALAREMGFDETDVDLQVIGYTQVASLIEGRVDAAVCYTMNEPVQLENMGYEVNVFDLQAYTSLPSNGIVTSERVIEENPELIEHLLTAFQKGLQDTLDDPDAAFEITRATISEMDDETAILQRQVLDACLTIWQADKLGEYDATAWAESVALMQELGVLAEPVDPQTAYTNEFLP